MGSSVSWDKNAIVGLLDRNPVAVERAIVAIYRRQTAEEQQVQDTRESNGVGFSGAHAQVGSYYATWILSGKHLSGKHLEKARNMAKRYTRQLVEIAGGAA